MVRLLESSDRTDSRSGADRPVWILPKYPMPKLREVRRKKIAMVFQSFALMPHMSVLENTAFGMDLPRPGFPPRSVRRKRWTRCVRSVLRTTLMVTRTNSPAVCASARRFSPSARHQPRHSING
ncbi:hypothetical protein ACLK1Y_14895 [Escherichia coli]